MAQGGGRGNVSKWGVTGEEDYYNTKSSHIQAFLSALTLLEHSEKLKEEQVMRRGSAIVSMDLTE